MERSTTDAHRLGDKAAPSSEKAGDGQRDFGFIRGRRRGTETWVPSNDG
jgi:hypothetical protein